jgi:hypothetical protein
MSLPSYLKHLVNQPLVGPDGVSILNSIAGVGMYNPILSTYPMTTYKLADSVLNPSMYMTGFEPPVLLDTGIGKPRLVPPGPITLYNPLNPFQEPITVTPTQNIMTPLSPVPILSTITRTYNSPLLNVTISGVSDDVQKVIRLLESLSLK